MTGFVDSSGRALLRIRIRHPANSTDRDLDVWIDTGFTGELVLPTDQVVAMNVPIGSAVKAALADGSEIQLDTYTCLIDWFGELKSIEVVANHGKFPLLGVGLMLERELKIDFPSRTLNIS